MRSRRGVTLIEIAIVTAIIGILAGIGAGLLTETIPSWRTRRAANEFLAQANAARAMAISDGAEYRIWFETTDADPSASGAGEGTYWVQKGNAAKESSSWDTLPVEMDGANSIQGEGYVNIADGEEDELPGVTIQSIDPALAGPAHGGSPDAIHFGPAGLVLNDGGDFGCDITGDGGSDGFICVRFVNKEKAQAGDSDVWVVSISRAGMARIFHGETGVGYAAGSDNTTANVSTGTGYAGASAE
ncbi:MAG: prepilin-type N-terminal cleavage/methylation domain-containing protein [Deltaproteobacteria bacterium]|nr:prepilin-type N-terminal cleavage/methylation domain-containing protein [Deltaproteobacteria bacterium]